LGIFSTRAIRHEWHGEHLTERLNPPALSLDERGMIQDCSKSLEKLFGFRRRDLVWKHVSQLFPRLADVELVQSGHLNPLLNYLCHCGHLYEALNSRGETFSSNLSFVHIEFDGRRSLRLIVRPTDSAEA
jgi:hypothetical protein